LIGKPGQGYLLASPRRACGSRGEVQAVAADYGIEDFAPASSGNWERLMRRVDVIPSLLVLARAANESAWGTSGGDR